MVDKHFADHLRTVLARRAERHPRIETRDGVAVSHTIVTSYEGMKIGTPPQLVLRGRRLPRRSVWGFEVAERMLDTAREVLAELAP